MSKALTNPHPLEDEARPARPAASWLVPLRVLMVLSAALAVLLVGATLLQLTGDGLTLRTSALFGRLLAGAVALTLVVALPLFWERNARRRWRQTDPLLRHPRVSWVLPWSLVVLLAPALLAPDLTRAALSNHGGWMLPGAAGRVVARGARGLAMIVPTQTPLALTHRAVWPWVDRESPACRGALPAR
ncbi:MAG: hypothetical protein JWM10_1591 [Myxococcaceae bacterium]|nr:hypothetical protein [Myxococcaceae bacterium]